MHKPTPEQEAIIKAARDSDASLMVKAYAGCAKTTTLEMLSGVVPEPQVLAVAFNVKIKKELEKRFPSTFKVSTLNGLGHNAFGKAIGKRLILEEKKIGQLVTQLLKASGFQSSGDQWGQIKDLVNSARQAGLVPEKYPNRGFMADTEENWTALAFDLWIPPENQATVIGFAKEVLIQSITQAFKGGIIDYDDQIYMSALFNGVFQKYPLVLVDEAQDLSPLNHLMIQKSCSGRFIVVGDPKQAIYQFRGADSASMEKIRAMRPNWIDLTLATTFRCPKVVVARQQRHAPGFTAADSNEPGRYWSLPAPKANGHNPDGWTWDDVADNAGDISVLCRNNAPLVGMAFKLIRKGVGCQMLGRDIGKNLVTLSKKILPDDDLAHEHCLNLVNDWKDGELRVALANQQESKISQIEDRAECLLAVLENTGVKNARDLRRRLEEIFASQGKVTVSTGHRAKGLEWDSVLHLDSWRIPSKYAQGNPVAMEQEKNLHYVIETRTKRSLVEARLETFV